MWSLFKKKDPLEAQKANYVLAFDIVPKVMTAFNNGILSLSDLEKSSTFMNFADNSSKKIIKWEKLLLRGTNIKNHLDKYMIIIRFPKPFTLSSAKAGAIVVDKPKHQMRYFTLEISFDGCMIVEILNQNRYNTGITIADSDNLTEFASIVYNLAVKEHA